MPSDFTKLPRLHIAGIELPREVQGLYDLACNLWWTWNPAARQLFATMDGRAWSLYRNPVQLLINFDRSHWEAKLDDEHFRGLYQKVMRGLRGLYRRHRRDLVRQAFPGHPGSDRLLLHGVRPSPVPADLLRRPRRARRRSPEERERLGRPPGRRRAPLSQRLLPPELSTPMAASSTSTPTMTSPACRSVRQPDIPAGQ